MSVTDAPSPEAAKVADALSEYARAIYNRAIHDAAELADMHDHRGDISAAIRKLRQDSHETR